MSSLSLRQIFKNEGRIIDTYVSQKARLNKPYAFGFVRFVNEKNVIQAVRRNNGLMIKGRKILVSMSRYQQWDNKTKGDKYTTKKLKGLQKVWMPSKRDGRPYNVVV